MDGDPRAGSRGDRRVAITGLGVVSGLGIGVKPFWESLLAGRTALRPLGEQMPTVSGPLRELSVALVDDDQLARAAGGDPAERTSAMLGAAVTEALAHSGLPPSVEGYRCGMYVGTCQGVQHTGDATEEFPLRGETHVADMYTRPVEAAARRYGVRGPVVVLSTACASSTTALGWAAAEIRDGRCDVVLAGGVETLCLLMLAGFHGVRATSPSRCAPYTRSDGMSVGEGAAVLVLEDWAHASRRGATVLAEFLGCGMSADGYHVVAPDPTGHGAVTAVRRALRDANLTTRDVDYVSGHGTGTASNDAMELAVMRQLFGERVGEVPISSIKSAAGHTVGATGAMEAVTSVLALGHGVLPPTVGVGGIQHAELDIVPDEPRRARIDVVLSTNYAFGGNNAAILLGSARGTPGRGAARPVPLDEVWVTGIGALTGAGVGREALARRLAGPAAAPLEPLAPLPEPPCPDHIPRSTWRRLDTFARYVVGAADEALRDAGIHTSHDDAAAAAAVLLATANGPMRTIEEFGRSLSDDLVPSRRTTFAWTTMTAATSTLGSCFGMRGPTATVLSGAAAGPQALGYARTLVARGEAPYALVVGADELTEATLAAQLAWWPRPGRLASGVVALVVESASRAMARGCRGHVVVDGVGHAGGVESRAGGQAEEAAFAAAIADALRASGRDPDEIDYVLAASGDDAANPVRERELAALAGVLPANVPIGRTRALLGETLAASGLVDVLAAALVMRGNLGLTAGSVRRVLVNTVGYGMVASTVLSARDEPDHPGAAR